VVKTPGPFRLLDAGLSGVADSALEDPDAWRPEFGGWCSWPFLCHLLEEADEEVVRRQTYMPPNAYPICGAEVLQSGSILRRQLWLPECLMPYRVLHKLGELEWGSLEVCLPLNLDPRVPGNMEKWKLGSRKTCVPSSSVPPPMRPGRAAWS